MKLIYIILISIGIWSCSNLTRPNSDESSPKLRINLDDTQKLKNEDLKPIAFYFIDKVDNTIITDGVNLAFYEGDYIFMDRSRKFIYTHNTYEDSTKTISINDHKYRAQVLMNFTMRDSIISAYLANPVQLLNINLSNGKKLRKKISDFGRSVIPIKQNINFILSGYEGSLRDKHIPAAIIEENAILEYISTFNPRLIGTYYSMSGFAERTAFDDKIKFLIPFENIIYSINTTKIKPYLKIDNPNFIDISKVNSQDELFKSFTNYRFLLDELAENDKYLILKLFDFGQKKVVLVDKRSNTVYLQDNGPPTGIIKLLMASHDIILHDYDENTLSFIMDADEANEVESNYFATDPILQHYKGIIDSVGVLNRGSVIFKYKLKLNGS